MRPQNRPTLGFTWIAFALGAIVQLALPIAPRSASDWVWTSFAPARRALEASGGAATFYPLAAAIQVVLIGLALDLAVHLLRRRRLPAADPSALLPWKILSTLAFATVTAVSTALLPSENPSQLAEPPWAAGHRQEVQASMVAALESARVGLDDEPRIVLVGDSLSGGAFHVGADLEPLIEPAAGLPVRFVKLTGASWNLVELERHIDAVLELEPDLLILQANMLFEKSAQILIERQSRSRFSRWSSRLALIFVQACAWLSIRGPGARPAEGAPEGLAPVGARHEEQQIRRWSLRRATPDDPNLALGRELLRRARARGARLAIVVLPVTERARLASPGFLADRLDFAEQVAAELGATLLAGEATWPDEFFADGVHLNPTGKQRFSTEIAPRLGALLR